MIMSIRGNSLNRLVECCTEQAGVALLVDHVALLVQCGANCQGERSGSRLFLEWFVKI